MGELVKIEFNETHFHGSTEKAREVHEVLGVKKAFTDWFKYHAKHMMLEEGEHYIKVTYKDRHRYENIDMPKLADLKSGRGGDRRSIDYIISVDIAKHYCMASQTAMAHRIIEYIVCVT